MSGPWVKVRYMQVSAISRVWNSRFHCTCKHETFIVCILFPSPYPLLWTHLWVTVCTENRHLLTRTTMWFNDNITIRKSRWCSILSNKHCCSVILNKIVVPSLGMTMFKEHDNWLGWTTLLYNLKVFFLFHFSNAAIGTGVWAEIFSCSQPWLHNVLTAWCVVRML